MSKHLVNILAACVATAVISACGGGGAAATVAPQSSGGDAVPASAATPTSTPGAPAGGTPQSSAPAGATGNATGSTGTTATASSGTPSTPLPAAASADPTKARFNGPQGMARTGDGSLIIADTKNKTIRKIAANGSVTTLAGMAGEAGSADGSGSSARFTEPRGVAADQAGNLYVTDGTTVRMITPTGRVTTLAGVQGSFGNADGTGSAARFMAPTGIAVDAAGNVFVADPADTALVIRKITPAGVVTTFAGGNRDPGSTLNDGNGTAARFVGPNALAIDATGNLYVADTVLGGITGGNLADGCTFIRKISPAAQVSTVAGSIGYTTIPGISYTPQELAQFVEGTGMVVDANGGITVLDHFNHSNRLQRIAADGSISAIPLAGGLAYAYGIVPDDAGGYFVTDSGANTVNRISVDGTVSVYAGATGMQGQADSP